MDMFRFKLNGLAHLTDPCYDAPENKGEMNFDGSGLYNVPCAEGYWIAARLPTDEFGEVARENRVVGFTLVSEDYDNQALRTKRFLVGVDSGQFGIFDASIYENDSDYEVEGSFYRTACDITTTDACGTIFDSGFVSSSGYGDGGYDLICGFLDGVLVYASITFIQDHSDEDDELDWSV